MEVDLEGGAIHARHANYETATRPHLLHRKHYASWNMDRGGENSGGKAIYIQDTTTSGDPLRSLSFSGGRMKWTVQLE